VDISFLPRHPSPLRPASAEPPAERCRQGNIRQSRVVFDLALFAAIVLLLVWLGQAADAIRHAPHSPRHLDFRLVQEQFAKVRPGMSSEEVFRLLGPYRLASPEEPEFQEINRLVQAHPDRYPGKRYWAKWEDPEDDGKWVAVLVAGESVYHVLKKGL
jgi:hypothetical protein